jgi:hypothetical protein
LHSLRRYCLSGTQVAINCRAIISGINRKYVSRDAANASAAELVDTSESLCAIPRTDNGPRACYVALILLKKGEEHAAY